MRQGSGKGGVSRGEDGECGGGEGLFRSSVLQRVCNEMQCDDCDAVFAV